MAQAMSFGALLSNPQMLGRLNFTGKLLPIEGRGRQGNGRSQQRNAAGDPLGIGITGVLKIQKVSNGTLSKRTRIEKGTNLCHIGAGERVEVTVGLCAVAEARDKVPQRSRNSHDKVATQGKSHRVVLGVDTKAVVSVGPELFGPTQNCQELISVPFHTLRDLGKTEISPNHTRE